MTERQQRELDYHRLHAKRNGAIASTTFSFDVLEDPRQRWWNAYWQMYVRLTGCELKGKRVLVVGCGFGEDALRLAKLGANVSAFDLCPESLAIAKALAERHRLRIDLSVMAAERLTYDDDTFDCVVARDILHHVDIPATMKELARVAKSRALFVINEIYSHSSADRVRHWSPVENIVYPRMQRLIYGSGDPYITKDERKLNERDLAEVEMYLQEPISESYFNCFVTRIVPERFTSIAKADRLLLMASKPLGRFLAGRIVLTARCRKTSRAER